MEQKTERKPDQKTDQSLEAKDVIQVRDLYKVYRMGDTKVYALNGVSFGIPRGEFCAITGPSGSGKLPFPGQGDLGARKVRRRDRSENPLFRRPPFPAEERHDSPPSL